MCAATVLQKQILLKQFKNKKICISELLQLIKISVRSPHLAREYYPKDKQHETKAQFLITKQSFQSIFGENRHYPNRNRG